MIHSSSISVDFVNVVKYLYRSQETNTCSKSTMEALEKGVKYIQS